MLSHQAILSLLALSGLQAAPDFRLQPDPARLRSPAINEASGLAISPSAPDFMWIVNDSGGTPELHLANIDGTPRGFVEVIGTKNIDWEDLAAFTYEGKTHLLIADTGDNNAQRESVNLLIVREPTLPDDGKSLSGGIGIAWKINFTYEGGPRDCEAVAVDSATGKIILVSKRTDPPMVYELPLRPEKNAIHVARKIGTTRTIAPVLNFIPHSNQPTGMDISRDGALAVIVTYYGLFLFPRNEGQSWAEAFSAKPHRPGSHKLPQAESVAFSPDAKTIFVVSEGLNSPIATFR